MTNAATVIGELGFLLDSATFNQPALVRERPAKESNENTDLQVFYQPEGVSLRFYPQPEANAG